MAEMFLDDANCFNHGSENIRRTSATTSSSSDEDPTGDGPRYRKTGTDEGPVSLGAMEPLPDTTIPSNPATVPDKTIPRDARDSARTGGVARVRASVKALHLFHLLAAIQSLTSDVNQAGHSKASLASSDRHDGAEKGNVSFTIDTSKLDVKVSQIQRYITLSAGAGYRKCPSHNLSEVEARLVQVQDVVTDAHQNTVPDTDRGSPQARPRREHRGRSRNPQSNRAPPERRRSRSKSYMVVAAEEAAFPYGKPDPEETARRSKRIVKLSKRMFRFFLPLDYRSEMTSKYWGAIKSLLDVSTV